MYSFKGAFDMLARRVDNASRTLVVSGGSMAWMAALWATESLSKLRMRALLEVK